MTYYPQGKDATRAERERTAPLYTDTNTHPFWNATSIVHTDKVAQQAQQLNTELYDMSAKGTMSSPLRMWNTATTTIPLGNVKAFNVAAPVIRSDAPPFPFGQVNLDQDYPFPRGAQSTFGFM